MEAMSIQLEIPLFGFLFFFFFFNTPFMSVVEALWDFFPLQSPFEALSMPRILHLWECVHLLTQIKWVCNCMLIFFFIDIVVDITLSVFQMNFKYSALTPTFVTWIYLFSVNTKSVTAKWFKEFYVKIRMKFD